MRLDCPTVLTVDDENDLADLYSAWLTDDYTVRTAYSGSQALDLLDDAVDVVLLDRRMPDLSGDEVLDEIRERDLDCRVAMVTAVEPDFDVIEMGFDDYLTKPVSEDDLRETVDQLMRRTSYDEHVREHFSLVSTRAVLEAEMTQAELEDNEEYARLQEIIAESEDQLEASMDDLGDADFHAVVRGLSSPDQDTESEATNHERTHHERHD